MKFSTKSVALFFTFALAGLEVCSGQIREVSRPFLRDIGLAKVDRRGNATVYMNPLKCRQLGPELCEYFRNHEYGHIYLNHFGRGITVQQAEAEADRYAARVSSPAARNAAYNFFRAGNGASRMHGNGYTRAQRVAGAYAPPARNRYRVVPTRTLSAGVRTIRVPIPSPNFRARTNYCRCR